MKFNEVSVTVVLEDRHPMTVSVPLDTYQHLVGSLGVYVLSVPSDQDQFLVVLSNGGVSGQPELSGIHHVESVMVAVEGNRLELMTPGLSTVRHNEGTKVSLQCSPGGVYPGATLFGGAFKVLRFRNTRLPLATPADRWGFPAGEWASLFAAASDHTYPATQYSYFGHNYGWHTPLGVPNVGGAAGGTGITPDAGARESRPFIELQSDMSMNRNNVVFVDTDGVPAPVLSRTSLSYEATSFSTWAPYAVENKVDPWYSTWYPRMVNPGYLLPSPLIVPDDGQHFCRAFAPALAAFERYFDPAAFIYLNALVNSVMTAYPHSRLRNMQTGPKGALGREFGWVSFFMGRFLSVLTLVYSRVRLDFSAAEFGIHNLSRVLANWCAAAANVYRYQQLPSGAFQALVYPSPGMSPDPWEVDRVPRDAVLAQGIEHAILTIGSYSVGAGETVVLAAARVYHDMTNLGAHWIQVGRVDTNHNVNWLVSAYARPEGVSNSTNVPWALAVGELYSRGSWITPVLDSFVSSLPVKTRPDMYFVHRVRNKEI